MKREIKFRAWDEEEGMMHPPFTINEICEIRKEGGGFGAILMNFNWDQLMWLQFTGLKDKNGKEIYEGDIFRYRGDVKVLDDIAAFYWANFEGLLDNKYIEVIGNIYENPELLN